MTTREALLARSFIDLTAPLVGEFDLFEVMLVLVERTVELTAADAAGILFVDASGGLRLLASTSDAVETVELFQIQSGEGPCRDCCLSGEPVIEDDLHGGSASTRWPKFAPVALGAGYLSVHAFPLRYRDVTIGALGLFSTTRQALGSDDVALTQALADVATIAVLQSRATTEADELNAHLQRALDNRIVIEQAKGVIAEQAGLDMHRAFDLLRRYARSHNRLLVDVADAVVGGSLAASDLR